MNRPSLGGVESGCYVISKGVDSSQKDPNIVIGILCNSYHFNRPKSAGGSLNSE